MFHDALEAKKLKFGDDHPATLETKNDLAMLHKEQSHYYQAKQLLLEALEGRSLKIDENQPRILESMNNLIDLYETSNKPEKAEQWRARLPQAEITRK